MRVRGVRYNARTETRNALCVIVEWASHDEVEFRVAHKYGIPVNARGPIRGSEDQSDLPLINLTVVFISSRRISSSSDSPSITLHRLRRVTGK